MPAVLPLCLVMTCPAVAAEPARDPGAGAITTAYRQVMQGPIGIIVRPDGGGLEADPDIGMPAAVPPETAPPARSDRR
jgi:hypothetical protein